MLFMFEKVLVLFLVLFLVFIDMVFFGLSILFLVYLIFSILFGGGDFDREMMGYLYVI